MKYLAVLTFVTALLLGGISHAAQDEPLEKDSAATSSSGQAPQGNVRDETLLQHETTSDEKRTGVVNRTALRRALPAVKSEPKSSRLENAFSRKTLTLMDGNVLDPFARELSQFGYEFFRNSSHQFDSATLLPVGSDYVIGPGDTLNISLWGSLNGRHDLTVDRQGEIMIPRVGVVKVWGLTYDQAKDAVNKTIGRYYKNYEFSLTLGRIRSIQVFVVGEVEAPGSYPVSSLSTVINALSVAGGPTRNGSLRSIKVNRSGQAAVEVDLYDMFLSGDRSKDIRLQNGDTIFVPVIGPVVAVAGEVRRPAIYEIKGGMTLPELLKMAGGVTAAGYTNRIQVERVANNTARIVLDYEPKDGTLDNALGTIQVHGP